MKGFIFSLLFLLGFLSFIKAPPSVPSEDNTNAAVAPTGDLLMIMSQNEALFLHRETDFELNKIKKEQRNNYCSTDSKTETKESKSKEQPLG